MVFSVRVLVCAPFFMFAILILLVPGRLSARQRPPLASELDFDTNPNPSPSHGQMTRVWRGLGPDSGFGFDFFPRARVRIRVEKLLPATLQDPLDPSQHRQGLMAKANHVILDKTLLTAELDQTAITCKTTTFQHPPPLSLD